MQFFKLHNRKEVYNMIFYNNEHKKFYYECLTKSQYQDSYHKALFYALGIDGDCRQHIHQLYDFSNHQIKLKGLDEAWHTSGSFQATLLAFNLFNGFVYERNQTESTPYQLFASEYGAFFIEAVKVRYPEYTKLRQSHSREF